MGSFNRNISLAIAALAISGTAAATESYDLRYAPGIGGADMSAPFEGGWVFQIPAYVYSGHVKSTSPVSTTVPTPYGNVTTVTEVESHTQINVYGLLPRLSYMSGTTFLGATLGGTVLVPILNKKNNSRILNTSTSYDVSALNPAVPPAVAAGVGAQVAAKVDAGVKAVAQGYATANSNSDAGLGDLEVSPDPALVQRHQPDAVRDDRGRADRRLPAGSRREPQRRQVLDVPSGNPVQPHRRRLGPSAAASRTPSTR